MENNLGPEGVQGAVGLTSCTGPQGATLYLGDCLEKMKELKDDSVDTIITDPPYGLSNGENAKGGFMGKEWDKGVPGEIFWKEMLRVAKPGSMLMAFGGTRTHHRLMCAIEDAGWEIRDSIAWVYSSGMPKGMDIAKMIDKQAGVEREIIGPNPNTRPNHHDANNAWRKAEDRAVSSSSAKYLTTPFTDAAKKWQGWWSALKPAWEIIVLAQKPLDGTYVENALNWDVAGLNIDECRIENHDSIAGNREGEESAEKSYKDNGSTNFAMKPGPRGGDARGRFPANIIFDEESGRLLDAQSGISKSTQRTGKRSGKDKLRLGEYAGQENVVMGHTDSGGASRFFYCSKTSKAERGEGNDHPTVKPQSLLRYLCRLTKTPFGGVVLDPFMGSGSTGIAALSEHRQFIGMELDPRYFEIAKGRIAQ